MGRKIYAGLRAHRCVKYSARHFPAARWHRRERACQAQNLQSPPQREQLVAASFPCILRAPQIAREWIERLPLQHMFLAEALLVAANHTLLFSFFCEANFCQNIFHQTPFGKGGLEQIETHKGREKIPIWTHIMSQR